jgi:hypothetical protein
LFAGLVWRSTGRLTGCLEIPGRAWIGGVSVTKKQHWRLPDAGSAYSLRIVNRTTGGSAPDRIVTLVTRPSPGAPPEFAAGLPTTPVENQVQSC